MIQNKLIAATSVVCCLGVFATSAFAQIIASSVTMGTIENVQGNKFVIQETKNGRISEVVLDSSVKIFGPEKKALLVKDIKIGDTIAAISAAAVPASTSSALPVASSSSTLLGKIAKVYVKQASASGVVRQVVNGVITGNNNQVLTILEQGREEQFYTATVLPTTKVKIKGIEAATTANLELGMGVVVVGSIDADKQIEALLIHVIPANLSTLP